MSYRIRMFRLEENGKGVLTWYNIILSANVGFTQTLKPFQLSDTILHTTRELIRELENFHVLFGTINHTVYFGVDDNDTVVAVPVPTVGVVSIFTCNPNSIVINGCGCVIPVAAKTFAEKMGWLLPSSAVTATPDKPKIKGLPFEQARFTYRPKPGATTDYIQEEFLGNFEDCDVWCSVLQLSFCQELSVVYGRSDKQLRSGLLEDWKKTLSPKKWNQLLPHERAILAAIEKYKL